MKKKDIIEDLTTIAERVKRMLTQVYPDPLGGYNFIGDVNTMVDLIEDLQKAQKEINEKAY